jgi:hypothetical protein
MAGPGRYVRGSSLAAFEIRRRAEVGGMGCEGPSALVEPTPVGIVAPRPPTRCIIVENPLDAFDLPQNHQRRTKPPPLEPDQCQPPGPADDK